MPDPVSVYDFDKAYRGRRVLITGGLGFIGGTLAHRLVALGADVTLMDSLIPGYGGNRFNIAGIEDRVRVNISDVRDRASMDVLVEGQDYLFNLAGTLSHVDSLRDPFTDLEINCAAQLSILEACRHKNPGIRVVFAGTRSQYGPAQYLPVDEKHPMVPADINGIHNIAGEGYHLLYHRLYGIRAASLRLTNTYGPRHQMRHSRQGVINWFVRQVMEGRTVRLFGDGRQVRDANYVDDVVEAFLRVMIEDRACGRAFNLGGDAVPLKDLVDLMVRVHGKGGCELAPYPEDSRKVEVGDYVADWSAFRALTGWTPQVRLEEGLRRTFQFYEKHRAQYW